MFRMLAAKRSKRTISNIPLNITIGDRARVISRKCETA
jgi:hypothetical protein